MRYLLFCFEWGLVFNTHLLKKELSEKVKKEQEVLSFCLPALTSLQVWSNFPHPANKRNQLCLDCVCPFPSPFPTPYTHATKLHNVCPKDTILYHSPEGTSWHVPRCVTCLPQHGPVFLWLQLPSSLVSSIMFGVWTSLCSNILSILSSLNTWCSVSMPSAWNAFLFPYFLFG